MCDFPSLTKKMFESLADIEAGRFVFVVAIRSSGGKEGSVEDVIVDRTSNPRLALERHCKSKGVSMDGLICMPVILPPGLNADAVRGVRSVRTEKSIWIEYTGTI